MDTEERRRELTDRHRVGGPTQTLAPPRKRKTPVGRGDRGPQKHRPLYIQSGVVSQARGSCFIECGASKLMVACYGPRDHLRTREYSSRGKLDVELKFAPFSAPERIASRQNDKEREQSQFVARALAPAIQLEKYPKSVIGVYVTILEDDGSALSLAVTAASVALADAGIELFDLVSSCTVAWTDKQQHLVDPQRSEQDIKSAEITVAYIPSFTQLSAVIQNGEVPFEEQANIMDLAITTCSQIYQVQQHCLKSSYLSTLKDSEATP